MNSTYPRGNLKLKKPAQHTRKRVNVGEEGETPKKQINYNAFAPSKTLNSSSPLQEQLASPLRKFSPSDIPDRPTTSRGKARPSPDEFTDYVVPSPMKVKDSSGVFRLEEASDEEEQQGDDGEDDEDDEDVSGEEESNEEEQERNQQAEVGQAAHKADLMRKTVTRGASTSSKDRMQFYLSLLEARRSEKAATAAQREEEEVAEEDEEEQEGDEKDEDDDEEEERERTNERDQLRLVGCWLFGSALRI